MGLVTMNSHFEGLPREIVDSPQTMATLEELTFCFAWRYFILDGISAELEDLASTGQSAHQKI